MTEHQYGSHSPRLTAPELVGAESDEIGDRAVPEASWSIRRAIELLDEAVDRMGRQLVRAADASMDWSDVPPGSELRRPAARSARRADVRMGTSALDLDPGAEAGTSIRGSELP